MEKSQPIVIVAENNSSVASGIVELFNVQNMADSDYVHTGETEIREEKFRNVVVSQVYQSATYFYNQQYIMPNLNTPMPEQIKIFSVGNNLTMEVGHLGGNIETITGIVNRYYVSSYSYFSGYFNGIGNPYLANNELEDNGMNFFCFFQARGSGVVYLIYRDGTYPSDTAEPQHFVIIENEMENVVEKSSGIPNVDLRKIYVDIFGGAVYILDKVRIECISTDGEKMSAVCKPITYGIRTSEGNIVENPIYPILSVTQKVECADVGLNGLLLNADTIVNIESIPPHTKVRYLFYPKEIGSPTITFKRTNLDKELIIPELNKIEGISNEDNCTKIDATIPKETKTREKQTDKHKGGLLCVFAIGLSILATYKLLKD